MRTNSKAKPFVERMSHRGYGKAVGEMRKGSGKVGMSAGEKAAGGAKLRQGAVPATARKSRHCQSKDGNGG